jgi:HEAT repeat protein
MLRDSLEAAGLRKGRLAMAQVLDRRTSPEGIKALMSLRPNVRLKVFEEIAPTVSGPMRLRLEEVASLTDIAKEAQRLTRSPRTSPRLRGTRILALTGSGVKDLVRLLYDRAPEVRERAAEWAATHPEPAVVWGLLEMLNDSEERCRIAARDALSELGTVTVDHLARALTRTRRPFSDHGLVGALDVAAAVGDPRLTEKVMGFHEYPSPAVRAAAARALGAIGGSEVGAILEGMLDDPDDGVRAVAALALARVGRWRSAGRLGELLDDDAEQVRKAATIALNGLGAPGKIILRRRATSAIQIEVPTR